MFVGLGPTRPWLASRGSRICRGTQGGLPSSGGPQGRGEPGSGQKPAPKVPCTTGIGQSYKQHNTVLYQPGS